MKSGGSVPVLNRIGNGRLTYLKFTGNVRPVVQAGGSPLADAV